MILQWFWGDFSWRIIGQSGGEKSLRKSDFLFFSHEIIEENQMENENEHRERNTLVVFFLGDFSWRIIGIWKSLGVDSALKFGQFAILFLVESTLIRRPMKTHHSIYPSSACWFAILVNVFILPMSSASFWRERSSKINENLMPSGPKINRPEHWSPIFQHGCAKPELFGGLEHFLFSHILGIIIPIDFHIFQRGEPTTNQGRTV